jgi:hypothetical protein
MLGIENAPFAIMKNKKKGLSHAIVSPLYASS